MRHWAKVIGLGAATAVAACQTVQLSDEGIFRPQPGAALTAERLGPAGTDYRLEPQTLTTSDGVRL